MSTNNKEPGATLAVILYFVAWCVLGITIFLSCAGFLTQFLQPFFTGRAYNLQWKHLLYSSYVMLTLNTGRGILVSLVLFALAAIIRAINANTRELRKKQ
ncbi:MAG TPA: hypothetical protein HPP66_09175 [Planctomycetes bacterium]|nr:hypothetical protein [Planctomycetota bacterium]